MVKYYYHLNIQFSVWIYCKMYFIAVIKAVFSASLLQSSVSHDLQKSFWYADLQETFLIIINVKNCYYFCGNHDTLYFSEFFDE